MVFGFGSRSSKKKVKDDTHVVRMSPSLPQMKAQGVPWPSNLVNVNEIREQADRNSYSAPGAAKVSFSSSDHGPISYHKPFRPFSKSASAADGKRGGGGTIASLYMSHPPSSFSAKPERSSTSHSIRTRHSQRRTRVAPTFNLMVAGAQGTGKSSLIRLLIETADISTAATSEQRSAMDRFLRDTYNRTEHIDTSCIEICESRFDRILLSVIDTPGLNMQEGNELRLERQVSGIVKYLDLQYADTMDEESKVVRKSKGDQHVHLCIYLVDPDSVMPASSRRAQSSLPTKSRSEVLSAYKPLVYNSVDGSFPTDDKTTELEQRLTMSPADIRVIRRLSARVNVLPVIARADILTDEKLAAVKLAIRRGLNETKLGFGVFGPATVDEPEDIPDGESNRESVATNDTNGSGTSESNGNHSQSDEGFGSEESSDDERQPRSPVVKLNPLRRLLTRSTSRSRLDRKDMAMEEKREPVPLEQTDPDSLASVRFSSHYFAEKKPELSQLMPFAVIMPEQNQHSQRTVKNGGDRARPVSMYSMESGLTSPTSVHNDRQNGTETPTPTPTLKSPSTDHLPFVPQDLKGTFVRHFRWGTVDVLDPMHCDFAALRNAIFSTHLKVLKTNTKEVIYEKYRTEKLLARRATRNISDDDRKRLLEDLGL